MHEKDFAAFDGTPALRRLLRALSPAYLLSRLFRVLPASLSTQIYFDSLERPAYAYGLYAAALQAKLLGYPRIAAVELGVAGGNGLVALEALARRIGKHFGIHIQVHGFDSGTGLPRPTDHRDHPYLWRQGDYRMDENALRARLSDARLWLGPVGDTVAEFLRGEVDPLGFVSFDLDYYSSTIDALALVEAGPATRLPRVMCYFDDVIDPDYAFFTEAAGELLAIEEFNRAHPTMRFSLLRSLAHTKPMRAAWHGKIFVLHDFAHELYGRDFLPDFRRQHPLR
jgi:hypothetical protein